LKPSGVDIVGIGGPVEESTQLLVLVLDQWIVNVGEVVVEVVEVVEMRDEDEDDGAVKVTIVVDDDESRWEEEEEESGGSCPYRKSGIPLIRCK
jgi:hypothetical protein